RVHGARRRPHGGLRDARPERPADALPPGVQRPPLRALVARPVLPLHRGRRPALRPRGDPPLSRTTRAPPSVRGGALMRALLIAALCAGLAAGCRQDMHNQPKIKAQAANPFFPDDRGGRPLIPGTVTVNAPVEATAYLTGKENGQLVRQAPVDPS